MSKSIPLTCEVGPHHERVTIRPLPPADTYWRSHQKAQVVAAVQAGIITLDEVCERYAMSPEEFHGWERALNAEGLRGLRTDRVGQAAGDRKLWGCVPDKPWLRPRLQPWERKKGGK